MSQYLFQTTSPQPILQSHTYYKKIHFKILKIIIRYRMSQYLIQTAPPESTLHSHSHATSHSLPHRQINIQKSIFESPLIKMSYNDYLIKQDDKIVSVLLPDNSKHQEYQEIFKYRQKYQLQVKEFIGQTATNGGGYYFYNWISKDELIGDPPKDGVRLLAIYIFRYEYEKAQNFLQQWQKTIMTQMLSTVLKGFKNIYKIVSCEPQLSAFFLNRKTSIKHFNPTYLQASNAKLLLTANTNDLSNEDILELFHGMESLEEKKLCVLNNIQYLKQFLSYFPYTQINQYYQLIFAFMSNTEDQLEQKQIYKLLLQSREFNLLDRLNFAQILMPLQDRKQFIKDFQIKVMSLTHLSNLLFFDVNCHQAFQTVITNYLDQYGDLESIANVCLEYGHPRLMKYVDCYQEILVMSSEEKKAQVLQYQQYKKLGAYCVKKSISPEPVCKLFLNRINFADEKIEPIANKQMDTFQKICYVCYRKNELSQDLFIQCGRCKHGGHLSHLLKWYEESNNVCPKTDCSCYCV